MATLALQSVEGGLADVVFGAANAGGDSVPAGIVNANFGLNQVLLLLVNGGGAPIDVTVGGVETAVGAGDTAAFPVNRGVYPGGLVAVTYSAVTSVTVAALKL